MTILYITAFPPCQKTAGQDYSRRLLNDLAGRGHKVSLIYAEYPEHSPDIDKKINIIGTIRPSLKNCLALPRFNPFFTKRFNRKTLSLILSAAKDFDMLYFDFSQVHIYSLFINHPNKVLMCHDVICQKFSRKGRLFLPWIKRCEKKLLSTANRIITFSNKDCDVIKREYNLDSVPVNFYLKNGHFDYKAENISVQENLFCFYGAWNRSENTECLEWFLEKVYPRLPHELRFVIIGGGIDEKLAEKLSAYQNIKTAGFVENPVSEIAKCQALIAPLHKGAGVKVKVIDALSSGTPVVGTDVAFEGIEDNTSFPLFFKIGTAEECIKILANWKQISKPQKQAAADEFFARYNKNHFADMI